jgi:hypothetical protein
LVRSFFTVSRHRAVRDRDDLEIAQHHPIEPGCLAFWIGATGVRDVMEQ